MCVFFCQEEKCFCVVSKNLRRLKTAWMVMLTTNVTRKARKTRLKVAVTRGPWTAWERPTRYAGRNWRGRRWPRRNGGCLNREAVKVWTRATTWITRTITGAACPSLTRAPLLQIEVRHNKIINDPPGHLHCKHVFFTERFVCFASSWKVEMKCVKIMIASLANLRWPTRPQPNGGHYFYAWCPS